MDGHREYSPLERSRLLESSLEGGPGGSAGGAGGRPSSVSEFTARVGTPCTLATLTPYHSRYGLHSPMPGFPQYLMTGGLYPPYPPLLPGAGEPLSLLGPGVACMAGAVTTGAGSSHYQRLIEMQKEAYLASMSAAAASHHTALYGINTTPLHTFLDQTVVSHSSTPLSLVKQEPKDLSCSEKSGKRVEKRTSGFKVDLDRSLSSTPLTISASAEPRELKLSPLSSSPVSEKAKIKDTNTLSVGSSDLYNGKRSSAQSSKKHPSNGKPNRTTSFTTPALSQNTVNINTKNSPVSKISVPKTPSYVSVQSNTSTSGRATSTVSTPNSLPSSIPVFSESPTACIQTQSSASPIPVATVKHDGILLSALASPSSSAASSVSTRLVTLKQHTDTASRSYQAHTGTHVYGASYSYSGLSDKDIDISSSCDLNSAASLHSARSGASNNGSFNNNRMGGLDTPAKSMDSTQHSDDSSDIIVDSTESDEVQRTTDSIAFNKPGYKCAMEETIDRVASGISSDTESDIHEPTSSEIDSKRANKSARISSSPLPSLSRVETSCSTSVPSISSSATRTAHSKAQSVPSVVISGNIPVGIAVAQIRPHQTQQPKESSVSESVTRDNRHIHSGVSNKAMTQTSTSLTVPAPALAPSLVVTGTSVNQSPWLQQVSFPVHPAVNPSAGPFDPSFPITAPAGYKFAHDSLSGRIFLVQNGDFVEQGGGGGSGVWTSSSFASPTEAGNSHYQTNMASLPTTTIDVNGSEKNDRKSSENNPDKSTLPASAPDRLIPATEVVPKDRPDIEKPNAVSQPILGGNNNTNNNPAQGLASATAAATVLINPVTSINSTAAATVVKMERPTVESRGCSPIIFEDISSSLSLLSVLSSLTSKKPMMCTVGVQTCSDLMKGSRKRKSFPPKQALKDQGIQTSSIDIPTLNPLSVQCPDLYTVDPLAPHHHSLEVKDDTERATYNPFTDPQILQAADGLELLSALAEKRPKCSSIDDPKRIFPSPSDSFKSDSASIVAFEDTLSPGDSELKSGQCTPRREVRRELSPKWTLPKKEPQTVLAFGDFKTPSEIEVSDDSDVRVKLAEVQRQYKEKQKELAKIQYKKNEDSKLSKRGPGRPPKKKISSKRSDDGSSISPKVKDHQQPQKKKRPAEELVDRVFRKLPPIIKPGKVSRSIHYVKSKTGPFFRRKSASSLVKRNKDLFGFDESNWPSFSERKHQEKVKGNEGVSVKSKSRHRSGSSHSEDSKHSQDVGNIFSNFESFKADHLEKKMRQLKHDSPDHKKCSTSSVSPVIKTEPSSSSTQQESGLGFLAKFALLASTAPLSSSTASVSSTAPAAATTSTNNSSTTTSAINAPFSSSTVTTTTIIDTSNGINNTSSTTISVTSLSIGDHATDGTFSTADRTQTTSNTLIIHSSSFADSSSNIPISAAVSASIPTAIQTTTTRPPHVVTSTNYTTSQLSTLSQAPVPQIATTDQTKAESTNQTKSNDASDCSGTLNNIIEHSTAEDDNISTKTSEINNVTENSNSINSTMLLSIDVSPGKHGLEDDSDTDNSDSPNKKRKPGRPRKGNPERSSGGTETIWTKKSSSVGLLQVPESCSDQLKDDLKKLDPNAMKPLFLDEEWTRRRSERIFLSEPSPQPSPAIPASPRGEPIWKLSNFMPKSKKTVDLNKTVNENDKDSTEASKDQSCDSEKAADDNSSASSSLSNEMTVKDEKREQLSTSSMTKIVETLTSDSEDAKKIVKVKDPANSDKSKIIKQDSSKKSVKTEDTITSAASTDKSKSIKQDNAKKSVKAEDTVTSAASTDKSKSIKQDNAKKSVKADDTITSASTSHPLSDKPKSIKQDNAKKSVKAEDTVTSASISQLPPDKPKSIKQDSAKKSVKAEDTITSASISQLPADKPKSTKQDDAKKKKPVKTTVKKTESQPPAAQPSQADIAKKEKRAEEHSKIKLQKAKSLHDLTQRVKNKFSKTSLKRHEDYPNSKPEKKKRKISTDSSDSDNLPLASFKDSSPVPETRSCKLQLSDLREGLKVLYLLDGLFHAGTVKALQPPDVYGVLTAGQRGTRPHILCLEEILKWAVLDVKPESIRCLPEGTRVCAFWSQQFSCLYPGTVAKYSPAVGGKKIAIPVEFDDGDNGRIELDHIRLLPSDFPIVEYEPDPLELLPKRKQRSTSDASDRRKSVDAEPKPRKHSKENDTEDSDEDDDDDDDHKDKATATKRDAWEWEGKSSKKPCYKGKAKKVFYKAVSRGGETIKVGDSAVFVSKERVDCPYIGRIVSLWEGWNGQMMVRVQWYYHPEETECDRKLSDSKNALFESQHEDENDIQTIAHKCQVLSYAQYKKQKSQVSKKGKSLKSKMFYIAGFYDPTAKVVTFHQGVS